MIVRPRQHWLRLLLVWHGSVLRHILFRLGLNFGMAVCAVLLMPWLKPHGLELSTAPFSLIGIALAIFLGFRNSVSYDRFWEARKLWGGLLVASRCLLRQGQTLTGRAATDPVVRQLCQQLVALASVLRHQLRHSLATPAGQAELTRLLTPDLAAQVAQAQYPCVRLLRELARWVRQQQDEGRLSDVSAQAMDRNIDELTMYHGSCERIAATPIPYAYSVLLHRTVTVYCTLLPFSLVGAAGLLTPVVSVFIAYAFMALDAIASELEEPFGTEANDLPLNAMCLTIERSLLELCDADTLPAAAQPNRFHVLD